ncbi:MAG: FGGY-family carbohydrate kinase [Hespellia sp.]|nr:FGGY-family carbohydrate kinase [Hespellia sp.]
MKKRTIGIELGSTRIKAVLIDENHKVLASGGYDWENELINGVWTYDLNDVWTGLQEAYAQMKNDVWKQYHEELTEIDAIGISAMMHGYIVVDKNDEQLVPFRTWRNTITGEASEKLTNLFQFNIPQRWSIAHLYQAIINGEEHVENINYLTTLSAYIHWQLTGEKVVGIGDASGMFPIDMKTQDYDEQMICEFNQLIEEKKYGWKLRDILPKVLSAGESAGKLTEKGVKLLDPTGKLKVGIPMCPPEGDAGTGMVATNSVRQRTGNVSAGTSIFGMVVLEQNLSKAYKELDICMTPDGKPVAMAHCNNCSSDLNAWVSLFSEFLKTMDIQIEKSIIFPSLFEKSLEGDMDCGGLMTYNYFSGEHITGFDEGRPLFTRRADAKFSLANFMRAQIYSCFATLKIGMDILRKNEHVQLDEIMGHGGMFKTEGVAQRYLSAAVNTPVTVMETAGEGGSWGIAILAMYMLQKSETELLPDYLSNKVFANMKKDTISATEEETEAFEKFTNKFVKGMLVERAAVENL